MAATPLHRRLKLRHLELLAALDGGASVHAAARALVVTQPAASKLLREAEAAVGTRLFERSSRGVVATAAGTALIARARRLIASLDGARDELDAVAAGARGLARVGIYAVAAPVLVPRALAWLRARGQPLRVRVEEGGADALLGALREGALDAVIGRVLDSDDTGDFDIEPLYAEPIVVAARPGHALARRGRRISWPQAAACDWVMPQPNAPLRRVFSAWLARRGLAEPRCLFESVSILANITVVRESDALVMLPSGVAEHYSALGLVRVLPLPFESNLPPVSLLTRRGEPPEPVLAAFAEALRAVRPTRRAPRL